MQFNAPDPRVVQPWVAFPNSPRTGGYEYVWHCHILEHELVMDLKGAEAIRKMDRQWIIEAYSSKDLKDFDNIIADDAFFTGADGQSQFCSGV